MIRKKRLSLLLVVTFCLSSFGVQAQTTSSMGGDIQNVLTQIPGTERTIESFDKSFFSVTGFASVENRVNDRTKYIGTEYYREVHNERDFLDALLGAKNGEVKVIELKADLNLGWNELNLNSTETKKYNFVSKYKNPTNGFTNPELEESGVTKMKLGFLNGITIFSEKGNTIKHTEINLTRSSNDIIIRNITFDGMWQWDDTGAHKEVGWSLMKINGAQDIWFDHCTFTHAADGMIDLENGSSGVTLSWCKFGVEANENPSPDSQIYKSITYMEERYQKGELGETSRYYKLRTNGATMNQIMAYAAYHSKVNLNGSGDKDYVDYVSSSGNVTPDSNHRLEITVAYSKYNNVGQRVPMIRQGKGHLFNNHIDNTKHMALHNNPIFNEYGRYPLSRCINPRNGASIAADTCVFDGVEEVIIGAEKQGHDTANMNSPWDQLFQNARNSALVVNSRVSNSEGTYTGSSWDNNGENLFTLGFHWNDKSAINNWAWSSEIVGRENMDKNNPPEEPFEFTYNYDEDLPYAYKVVPLEKVTDVVENYAGAGVLDFTIYEWLKIEYGVDYSITVSEIENGTVSTNTLFAEAGEMVEVTAEPAEGYMLKSGTLKYNGIPIKENSFIMPNEDVVITAEFEKYIPVTNIKLNIDKATITTGSVLKLIGIIEPEEAQNKEIDWSSDNEDIAVVNEEGFVTGIEEGTATITATTRDGGFTASCEVKVVEEMIVPVTGIKLDQYEIQFTTSSCIQLIATVEPLDATNKLVNWSSSDEGIVKVEDGLVIPVGNGKAIVTATTSEGGFTVSCEVVVDIEAFRPLQYEVTISPMINGKVSTNVSQATAGEKIIVIVTPDKGYRLKPNTLKYNDNDIKNNAFVMPDEDVVITASFERVSEDSSEDDSEDSLFEPSSKPSKPMTLEEVFNTLTSKEKASIENQFKEYAPYTLLNGKLTLEQLKYLTNNKFSEEMLKELMEHSKMLEAIANLGTGVSLDNRENILFTDVTAGHWANEAIYKAASLGLIQGRPDGSFAPSSELKVADTFTSLDRYLLMNNFTRSKLSRSTVEKYLTNKEHWAFAHIASVSSKLSEQTLMEIINLKDESLPRELLAQVIYEVTEGQFERTDKEVSFKDIEQSPYKEALVYCIQTGILNGVTEELMLPEKALTRAELMVILMRMNDILQK